VLRVFHVLILFVLSGVSKAIRNFPRKHEESSVSERDRTRNRKVRGIPVRRPDRGRVPERETRFAQTETDVRVAVSRDSRSELAG